jgi:pimeloyl-ACP methyl ester carboxylesterase
VLHVPAQVRLEREGVGLVALDFGGRGSSVLLLHGLAGYAGEWASTASDLSGHARVVAFDARGHGESERFPADVSRAAHVADAGFVIDALELAPTVVVGHSLGGQSALLLAAQYPEVVRGLVVVEASPDSGGGEAYLHVERSLRSWPVPFRSRADAIEYFQGRGFSASVWADGLQERSDGWWPRFDIDVMVRTVREADSRTYWDEWESIRCPTLVVRGTHGTVPADHARVVTSRARDATLIEVHAAGHDVHLDQPEAWRRVLRDFIASLD